MNELNSPLASCIACGSQMQKHIAAISDDRYGCPGIYSIAKCTRCAQMATLPALKESDLPNLYSKYYPRREVNMQDIEREAQKAITPLARLRRWLDGTDNQGHYLAAIGQKVLDIGSGSCLALLELRAMGIEAWGVETDPNVQHIAAHFKLRVHIGSIHDNPFSELQFDRIVLNQVIEHIPDPLVLLKILRKRLTSNGSIVLSFPNSASLNARLSGRRWINWHVPYHQHHFNRESFQLLAQSAGFAVSSVRTITPNLWTLLQIRANQERPSEGQASSTWSNKIMTSQTQPSSLLAQIKRRLLSRVITVTAFIAGGVNRIVDSLGKGDSLLVELQFAGHK